MKNNVCRFWKIRDGWRKTQEILETKLGIWFWFKKKARNLIGSTFFSSGEFGVVIKK